MESEVFSERTDYTCCDYSVLWPSIIVGSLAFFSQAGGTCPYFPSSLEIPEPADYINKLL